MQDLINNPYLDPDYSKQFIDHDILDLISEDPSSKTKIRKPSKRLKYSSAIEAKEAQLVKNQEYTRRLREMVRSLPDGNELKEAKKQKARVYDKNKREKLKTLPNGDQRKEAYRLKRLELNRKRREMLKQLPDDDPRKQNHIKAQRRADRKYVLKRKMEDPEHFRKKDREQDPPSESDDHKGALEDLLIENHDHKDVRNPKRRTKYANAKEAKEAKLKMNQEYNRNWRVMVSALPDGSELKEARKKRDREYSKRKHQIIQSLPDGHEKKEAYRLHRHILHQEWRKKLKDLRDTDPKKQKHRQALRQAQTKYRLKRKAEDPEFFSKQQKERRARKRIAQEANP